MELAVLKPLLSPEAEERSAVFNGQIPGSDFCIVSCPLGRLLLIVPLTTPSEQCQDAENH